MTPIEIELELGRAYRALRGFYGKAIKGELPDKTMLAYHSPVIAAALRFVHEGALDGAQYFIGKHVSVMHEALNLAASEPRDEGRPVPHHGSGPDDQ